MLLFLLCCERVTHRRVGWWVCLAGRQAASAQGHPRGAVPRCGRRSRAAGQCGGGPGRQLRSTVVHAGPARVVALARVARYTAQHVGAGPLPPARRLGRVPAAPCRIQPVASAACGACIAIAGMDGRCNWCDGWACSIYMNTMQYANACPI